MEPDKVLVFKLRGEYAQFRKFFTNMSPLSFSIPPRTALTGILGAIIGIPKEENPETYSLSDCFIGLKLLKEVKKMKIAINYLKTTSKSHFHSFEDHKPTNVEFLKDVEYRLYFAHNNRDIYERTKTMLENHSSYYTVSLGISGCLANIRYEGEYELVKTKAKDKILMDSIVPYEQIEEIEYDPKLNMQKVTIPCEMKNDREVTSYKAVLYEMKGKPIEVKLKESYFFVGGLNEHILPL